MRIILLFTAIVILGGAALFFQAGSKTKVATPDELIIPTFSVQAELGKDNFGTFCIACHGENATGTDQGPPLINIIYESSHHGDQAFLNAALNGVRAHHWRFGNMPPVEGIRPEQVQTIITYVRELQRANGIQ